MEQEERKSQKADTGAKTKKAGRKVVAWGTFAAAIICAGVGIAWFGVGKTVRVDDNVMTQNAGGIPKQGDNKEGIFDGSSWYGSEENPEKIYDILLEKLSGDKRLQLTASEQENFETARVVSGEETENIIAMLEKGKLAGSYEEEEKLLIKQPVYYLAEFDDGVIVKFSIYEEQYFYCSEIDGVFELKD